MRKDLFEVTLTGNLGEDPSHRETTGGTSVCSFSVAVNQDRGPNKDPKTEWVTCQLWGRSTKMADYYGKGDYVFVLGSLEIQRYRNNRGEDVSRTVVNVRKIKGIGQSSGRATPRSDTRRGDDRRPRPRQSQRSSSPVDDLDLGI